MLALWGTFVLWETMDSLVLNRYIVDLLKPPTLTNIDRGTYKKMQNRLVDALRIMAMEGHKGIQNFRITHERNCRFGNVIMESILPKEWENESVGKIQESKCTPQMVVQKKIWKGWDMQPQKDSWTTQCNVEETAFLGLFISICFQCRIIYST